MLTLRFGLTTVEFKVTVPAKPLTLMMLSAEEAEEPGVMVRLLGLAASVKSGMLSVTTTVRVALVLTRVPEVALMDA